MKRGLFIVGLGGFAAFGLAAAGTSEPANPAPADPAAVAQYLDRLAATVPPPPATRLAKNPAPADRKPSKTAQRLDRAEPMIGALLDRGR